MLAPKITGSACANFIMPAFTKPTTVTVVAAELWIIAVTPVPRASPFHLLLVSFSRSCSSFAPARFSMAFASRFIP